MLLNSLPSPTHIPKSSGLQSRHSPPTHPQLCRGSWPASSSLNAAILLVETSEGGHQCMPPFTHYLHPTADQGAPTPHHHYMEAHHASLCGKEPEKGETPPPTRNLPLPQTGLEMSALLARKRREGEKVSAIGPHPPNKTPSSHPSQRGGFGFGCIMCCL